MAREYRVDRAELRPPQKRADGSVRYDAVLSRVGVFEYRQPDGTVRKEYRSAEEVGRADSLASLELTPVTDGHPPKAGLAKKVAVGAVGDRVDFDGERVKASVVILDDGINERVARGDLRELSPGYTVVYVPEPGVTPWGERYDGLQTEIIYEHHALVPRGRQGSTVALRTDEADGWRTDAGVMVGGWGAVVVSVTSSSLSQDALERAVKGAIEATPGMYLRTDAADRKDAAGIEVAPGWADSKGAAHVSVSTRELSLDDLLTKLKAGLASVDVTVGDPAAATPPRTDRADAAGHMEPVMKELQEKLAAAPADLAAATARADAAEAKAKTEAARADKAEGERDSHKDRADKAEKARIDALEAAPGQVRARLQLEAQAASIIGAEVKFDGMDDTAIKAAVVAKLTGKELPADKAKSPDYVSARFDAAMELAGEAATATAAIRGAIGPVDKVRVDDLEKIRADAHEAQRTAGTKPLTAIGSN